jgi:hypothetical protein
MILFFKYIRNYLEIIIKNNIFINQMDTIEDKSSKDGFFSYVFNFNSNTKTQLLNLTQYSFLSIIPIVIMNSLMQYYVPDADDTKNTLELIIEILFQILFIIICLFYINRILFYIPTISKENYQDVNYTSLILSILLIILSLQTKLGDKITILVNRFLSIFNKSDSSKKNKKKTNSSQVQQQTQPQQTTNDNYSTNLNNLPISSQTSSTQLISPDFNKMYLNSPTPDVNTSVNINQDNTIMAANEAFSNSFGGSFGTLL